MTDEDIEEAMLDDVFRASAEAGRDRAVEAVEDSTNRLVVAFRRWYIGQHGKAPTEDDFRDILARAALLSRADLELIDSEASAAHDFIWGLGVSHAAADAAIWSIHNLVRPALGPPAPHVDDIPGPHPESPDWHRGYRAAMNEHPAGLPALDVARLRVAVHRAVCDRPPGYSKHEAGNGSRCQLSNAEAVAAEYARLATPERTEPRLVVDVEFNHAAPEPERTEP